ncbi:response regulator [Litorimonas sp. RW-G-Af-16]|uniref:response regulator n=1 Tax=Litorimonas sp. RW-G-Af-16 TaxID=3241168 RepID=UPI003AAD886E
MASVTDPTNLSGVTVLIVEDVPSNQEIIKLLLAPQGIQCLTADSGADALDVLNAYPVDIVLMDVRMPGMDGVETTQAIRAGQTSNTHVPIIALTADTDAETNADCLAAGADVFLTKPVMRQELIDAIIHLRQQRAA